MVTFVAILCRFVISRGRSSIPDAAGRAYDAVIHSLFSLFKIFESHQKLLSNLTRLAVQKLQKLKKLAYDAPWDL